MRWRSLLIVCVWSAAVAAAFWLAQAPSVSATAPGQVVGQEFRLSPIETGHIAAVLVTPGQRVTGGQVLAQFDTSVLEREIAVAEARLRGLSAETSASAAVIESQGYQTERSFQTDVEEAASQLESAKASNAQEIAELKQLRGELQRQREYLREGLVAGIGWTS